MGNLTSTDPAVGQPITAAFGTEVAGSGLLQGGDVQNTAGTVTLATAATEVAGTVSYTFTLTKARRIKITTIARYQAGAAVQGRMVMYSAYNSGATPAIGSAVRVSPFVSASTAVAGAAGSQSVCAVGSALLPAGTYTAYASLNRASGGSATDIASSMGLMVEDEGAF